MGSYATNTQLKARFEDDELLTRITNSSTSVPDETVITDAIAAAEGSINGYLSHRYSTPVDASSDTDRGNFLRDMTLDIAQFFLLARNDGVSEVKNAMYQARKDWLKMAAKGEVNLPGAETPAGSASRDPTQAWGTGTAKAPTTNPRMFTRETQANL